MKAFKRITTVLLLIVLLLAAIFLAGRYGWKLCGFRACQGAGITSVEVEDQSVHMTGFYPGSFPAGFCGYYAREQYGKLYVGFRFSPLFGSFETGDFDIVIPVREEINEVILKTSRMETSIWSTQNGFYLQEGQETAYVKSDLHTLEFQKDDKAPDGTSIYRGNGKELTNFTVNVPENGVYTIVVEARRAKGSARLAASTPVAYLKSPDDKGEREFWK